MNRTLATALRMLSTTASALALSAPIASFAADDGAGKAAMAGPTAPEIIGTGVTNKTKKIASTISTNTITEQDMK